MAHLCQVGLLIDMKIVNTKTPEPWGSRTARAAIKQWWMVYSLSTSSFPNYTLSHFLSLEVSLLLLRRINLAVSVAVVSPNLHKHRAFSPVSSPLLSSARRPLPYLEKNLLAAFSPFWKYFSTAPSKPWGPFFGHTHTLTHIHTQHGFCRSINLPLCVLRFSHHLDRKSS